MQFQNPEKIIWNYECRVLYTGFIYADSKICIHDSEKRFRLVVHNLLDSPSPFLGK